MAIKLRALDTHIVLCGLHDYRESILAQIENMTYLLADDPNVEIPPLGRMDEMLKDLGSRLKDTERLIKSFTRSYAALERLGRW